ncbi:MAG: flagellar motor switch protein FliG [Pseudomonadales bacterium]|nr:flagellar motor switch protein FliG [Pseudomonadales bacterium]MDG2078071.1 flagellar motor switch protein FliG [Pseudomonadales bacterium]
MVDEKGTGSRASIPFAEKAAILLLAIGEEPAAEVLKQLGPKDVQRIGGTMAALTDIKRENIAIVFEEFIEEMTNTTGFGIGTEDYVRNMLTTALGSEKASGIIDRMSLGGNTQGLDTLKWMDARAISDIIRQEHPQIQAIVIAYLESDLSAEVLSYLPESMRLDIMIRVAKLDTVQPDALLELNNILERQFAGSSSAQKRRIGGTKVAADIMTNLDGSIETEIMDALTEVDEGLSTTIQDLMFVFANLLDVDDRGIQSLLREVATEVLVVALKGADDELREKIFTNMSSRAADLLRDDLEALGPMKVSDVEAAQKEILVVARRMAEAGDIILGGSGEQML